MKVTKKAVTSALNPFGGWNYAYNFKESQRIVLFPSGRIEQMKQALSDCGIEVVECVPPKDLCTGYMELARSPE